jgi:hypothetical protein
VSCEKYEELISLSVSGELSPDEKSELRNHISSCPSCSATMEREQRLWGMIEKSRWAEDAPDGMTERLLAKVRKASAPVARPVVPVARLAAKPAARRPWVWAVAVAAGLLMVMALIGASRKKREKPVLVARVTSGKLKVLRNERWQDTRQVYSGQLCRVPPQTGSEARLELADGSKVRLERGMALLLHRGLAKEIRGERTVELLSGALTADVAKNRNESERFVVAAPGGRVTATGTRFWVRAGPPEGKEDIMGKKDIVAGAMATALAVAVFEGSVLVNVNEAVAGEPIPIAAGEETKPVASPKAPPAVGPRTVASAVPADAILFIAAAGRAHWLKAVENSALGAAYREEKVKSFFKPVIERAELLLKDKKAEIEKNLMNTLKFSEVEAALQGEVGVAIVGMKPAKNAPEGDPTKKQPIFLVVAEVGEHAEAFETGMGEFIKRVQLVLEQEGGGAMATNLTARTYRGTDLRVFSVDKVRLAYAKTKGYFLFSLDEKSVEKAIDCLEGKAQSLASTAKIKKVSGGLMKVSAAVDKWIETEKAKNPEHRKWKEQAALGFDRAKRIDYRLRFEKPFFREEARVEFARLAGALTLLEHAKPVDAVKLAADAPGDALSFAAFRLPTDRIIPTVLKVMDENAPKKAQGARKMLVEMKVHGLELESLLADALDGEMAVYVAPVPGAPVPDVVLVAGLKSDEKVLGSLRTLATVMAHDHAKKKSTTVTADGKKFIDYNKLKGLLEQIAPQVVDYRGGKLIYVPVEGAKPTEPVPAAVLLEKKLIIAWSAAAAKRAAARLGGADSLAKKAAFADEIKKLPAGAFGVHYMDTARAFELIYALTSAKLADWKVVRNWGVDLQKMPPASAIGKHLKPEMTALYAGKKGLTIRAVGNVPRGLTMVAAIAAGEHKKKMERRRNAAAPAAEPGEEPPAKKGDPEPGIEEF